MRRNLTDTARHTLCAPHRGWKIALYVAMLIVPGGSLAALGFAWFDHRRQRTARGSTRAASTREPSAQLCLPAAPPQPVRCP
ncbi:ABC-type multidrug transport system, ATPase and permease components [Burkholderia singularis]|uniref:ABC-type multidrug transport system, ATPase and permease components n=1 Tax=Burkholderia singularis TaxID=1503053 RepID=A0A238HC90_9BURK|nr:ABC-type multidrug transport system, ATPase and permease components [Burkholderia singularis]